MDYIYTYISGSLCRVYGQNIGFYTMFGHSLILQSLGLYLACFSAPAG
jgi:hypothetical protein